LGLGSTSELINLTILTHKNIFKNNFQKQKIKDKKKEKRKKKKKVP
jgi:hypothetical protein